MFQHEPPCDLQSSICQINDSDLFLSFRFILRENPAGVFEIHVASFHPQEFLRTWATLPCCLKHILKGLVGNEFKYGLELGFCDALLAAPCLWLFHMGDGISFDVSHLLRPSKWSLNGDNAASLVTVRPIGVRVDPLMDVKWLELVSGQIWYRQREPLASLEIPLVRPLRTMLLRPFEKRVDYRGDGFRRNGAFLWLRHEDVKLLKRRFPIGTKIMPLAVDRDEPGFSILAIPRFWCTRHDNPLSSG